MKERIATEARRESRRQGNGTNPGGSGFTDEIGEAGDVRITGFRTVDVVREYFRACLKIAFRQLCVTLCGRFVPDEGGVWATLTELGANMPRSGACRWRK